MSSTNSVSGVTSSQNYTTSTTDQTTLSMNDFFKLLAAQLQNQSMLDPMDNTEFIGQMAQFSTLSQIQELTGVGQMTYAVSLLGKNVNIAYTDENGLAETVSGVVANVTYENGVPYVEVNGDSYLVSDVTKVVNGSADSV